MIITLIVLPAIIVIAGLVRGIFTEDKGLELLHIWGIIIVICFTVALTKKINKSETIYKSKIKVNPELEITTKIDDNTSKSDTIYIYTFKKE